MEAAVARVASFKSYDSSGLRAEPLLETLCK